MGIGKRRAITEKLRNDVQTGGQRYRFRRGSNLRQNAIRQPDRQRDACGFRLLARFRRRRMEAQQLVDSRAGGALPAFT